MPEHLCIVGGRPLEGNICIGGAKNAALPIMAASLLSQEDLLLQNIPQLRDVETMAHLLQQHGVSIHYDQDKSTLHLQADRVTSTHAPFEIVRKMRASILVLGPLLTRFGEARVALPGGCAIGNRPVDMHLRGLEAMGATLYLENGHIHATCPKTGLKGTAFTFPRVSVTGTENLMMAACLAEGTTHLFQAACEPEVVDLAHCLNAMGACIEGAGTHTITIEGQGQLHRAVHRVIPDRIETATYAIAAGITGGRLHLKETSLHLIDNITPILKNAGMAFESCADGFIASSQNTIQGVDVTTGPFPGFATDLQAQTMALLTTARGQSLITETIFENRFMHVPELQRLGANITVIKNAALVRGVPTLTGATVRATDLRASVCLVLAGLAAQGKTCVRHLHHLDRGYEKVEKKLSACGANIQRVLAT